MMRDVIAAKRVVVVDDSRTMQAMLTYSLEKVGGLNVVGIAGSASAAAAMVAEHNPDLVTIDLCMPYIDGTALLESLREHDDVCKIVISDHAAASPGMIAELSRLGAAACIGRSELAADPAAFVRTLHSAMARFARSRGVVGLRSLHGGDGFGSARLRRASLSGPPMPADEQARLVYLDRKRLANAVRERQFDAITSNTARLTAFPVCLMTFIDGDTQWIKSSFGNVETSTPRAQAFCSYTIAQDEPFVVRNAANDRLFADNPFVVGEGGVRTYVGAPIITQEGIHVGALCLIDTQVRVVSDGLLAKLKGMADIAAEMINSRPFAAVA